MFDDPDSSLAEPPTPPPPPLFIILKIENSEMFFLGAIIINRHGFWKEPILFKVVHGNGTGDPPRPALTEPTGASDGTPSGAGAGGNEGGTVIYFVREHGIAVTDDDARTQFATFRETVKQKNDKNELFVIGKQDSELRAVTKLFKQVAALEANPEKVTLDPQGGGNKDGENGENGEDGENGAEDDENGAEDDPTSLMSNKPIFSYIPASSSSSTDDDIYDYDFLLTPDIMISTDDPRSSSESSGSSESSESSESSGSDPSKNQKGHILINYPRKNRLEGIDTFTTDLFKLFNRDYENEGERSYIIKQRNRGDDSTDVQNLENRKVYFDFDRENDQINYFRDENQTHVFEQNSLQHLFDRIAKIPFDKENTQTSNTRLKLGKLKPEYEVYTGAEPHLATIRRFRANRELDVSEKITTSTHFIPLLTMQYLEDSLFEDLYGKHEFFLQTIDGFFQTILNSLINEIQFVRNHPVAEFYATKSNSLHTFIIPTNDVFFVLKSSETGLSGGDNSAAATPTPTPTPTTAATTTTTTEEYIDNDITYNLNTTISSKFNPNFRPQVFYRRTGSPYFFPAFKKSKQVVAGKESFTIEYRKKSSSSSSSKSKSSSSSESKSDVNATELFKVYRFTPEQELAQNADPNPQPFDVLVKRTLETDDDCSYVQTEMTFTGSQWVDTTTHPGEPKTYARDRVFILQER